MRPAAGHNPGMTHEHERASSPAIRTRERSPAARRVLRAVTAIGALLVTLALPAPAAMAAPPPVPVAPAWFEGAIIDLADADGWGPARACAVTTDGTHCYRTEAAMDKVLQPVTNLVSSTLAALSPCSTGLRLYKNTAYGGTVLTITARGLWQNLAAKGFDNVTSSYKVGSCSSILADGTSGGGSRYPGATGTGAQASAMASGWDNRISSVYLA